MGYCAHSASTILDSRQLMVNLHFKALLGQEQTSAYSFNNLSLSFLSSSSSRSEEVVLSPPLSLSF